MYEVYFYIKNRGSRSFQDAVEFLQEHFFFYVLLIVHLSIILAINQLNTQNLLL